LKMVKIFSVTMPAALPRDAVQTRPDTKKCDYLFIFPNLLLRLYGFVAYGIQQLS
jgi:hypothetical protein